MTAVILGFPRRSPLRAVRADSDAFQPFTPAWCDQHLPLVGAAMDLLEADDAEFASRCALMRDEDGRAMLDELAGQLQRLGTHVADVADALGLTAARIRDAFTRQMPQLAEKAYDCTEACTWRIALHLPPGLTWATPAVHLVSRGAS